MSGEVSSGILAAAREYEALFVPALLAPWTGHVTAAAGVQKGDVVLDIACGTGVLARHALSVVGPDGVVVGADPAPGMLAIAAEIKTGAETGIETGIEWVAASAEDLGLPDAKFDRVISQFGMMFFQDRAKAIAEMARVLKPGGSLAVAVWDDVSENPGYESITSILRQQVSDKAADILQMPFSLGDGDQVAAEFEQGGFSDVRLTTKSATARFANSRVMLEADLRGWLPMFDVNLSEEKIGQVLAASDAVLAQYVSSSGEAVFPTSAHIISATR